MFQLSGFFKKRQGKEDSLAFQGPAIHGVEPEAERKF
jgi:hypothetical protein